MILKDYFEEKEGKYLISENYIINLKNDDYLLSYTYKDHKWHLNCITHDYYNLNKQMFIDFVKPKTYNINHVMKTTYEIVSKMVDDYDNNYQYLHDCCVFVTDSFFKPITCVDNCCECAVEEFNSLTLAMLWLYKGYYTTGHNDLYIEE